MIDTLLEKINLWWQSLSWSSFENVLAALAIFTVAFIAAKLISRTVDRVLKKRGSEHGAAVATKIIFYALLVIGVVAALGQLGVKLTGLLTAAGIFTVALGFAAQTSVSNVISGIFLLIDRPFSINDTVKIDQTLGTIISVDLLSTKVRTFDNLTVRVPNEALLKSTITNYTLFSVRRVDVPVSVSYDTDLDECERVLMEFMADHDMVLDEPEPAVLVELLADSGVNLVIRAWVLRMDYIQAKSALTKGVKQTLDAEGIVIPFPQRVVHRAGARLSEVDEVGDAPSDIS
ncbi:MAG: mechanosensitive ion channel family protein [Myxococcota bacterium]